MEGARIRIATTSGVLAVLFSSALIATGAPGWVLALGTVAGIVVIWRYTGAFDLMRADWAEARETERRLRDERDRDKE
jgi:protein-S-isoprenylcysteine O-methyltransferase Ste14